MAQTTTPSTDWARIPVRLQHQFFIHAEAEAKILKRRLARQQEVLNQLKKDLPFRKVEANDEWKKWRIACIDGSFSPTLSERLGARYGVYAAGYMIFQGPELVEEEYKSNRLSGTQTGRPEDTEILLGLLASKLERELALRCLQEKNVDLILLDGAFFGFRVRGRYLPKGAHVPGTRGTVKDLIDDLREITTTLKQSGKTLGIIKRIRTEAIYGWLRNKHQDRVHLNDKAILASLMPPANWFAYTDLFGADQAFHYFSTFARGKHTLKDCITQVEERVKETLDCPPGLVLDMPRYYQRCSRATAPFCFETPPGMDVEPIVSYFHANHNPATGLPFPLDLIDANVGLPTSFTREFVEEVEALLIRDPELGEIDLANHFQPLNPQKED